MSEWRDIATAPKDGSVLIIHNPGGGLGVRYCLACWSQLMGAWDVGPRLQSYVDGTCFTHWMPLPDPPVRE